MKKFLIVSFSILISTFSHSQNINDALRYSQENFNGTARFRAMSGAFGSVGGDFSSISVNPAGSSIFSASQVGVTISNYNTKNKSDYFGNKTSQSEVTFDLNQAGAVFVFNTNSEKTKWKKYVLSINYDNTNDFDNMIYTSGTNPSNSIDKYFLSYANGTGLSANYLGNTPFENLNLRDRQAFLAYNSGIISADSNDLGNTSYVSNVPRGGNYFQDRSFESSGYNGKLSFNASAAYDDKLFIGLNINTYFTEYTSFNTIYEQNSNAVNANGASVTNITLDNQTHTFGNAFSFQLGAIAKITNELRLGLSYESSTWYQLNDEVRQVAYAEGINLPGTIGYSNSDIVIAYDPYELRTPGKVTGSLSYIFGKKGLISIDYSLKDYSTTRFTPNDDYFEPINGNMSEVLTTASEIRVGAEYRIKNWSLRGGFRNDGSPYKDTEIVGDLMSFSGGFGYNFPRTRIDLAYTYAQRETNQGFFTQGLIDRAQINAIQNNFALTVVFDL